MSFAAPTHTSGFYSQKYEAVSSRHWDSAVLSGLGLGRLAPKASLLIVTHHV